MFEKTTFDKAATAQKLINDLPSARIVDLAAIIKSDLNKTAENISLEDHKGVLNENYNVVAQVVSKHYKVIQHQEFLSNCLSAIEEYDKTFKGIIRTNKYGNEVIFDIFFNDKHVEDDTDDGINLGFRMTNSYNCSKAASVLFFGYRHYCENGMIFGMRKRDIFYQKHIGDFEQMNEQLPNFFARAMERKESIQEVINKMMATKIKDFEQEYELVFRRERENEYVKELIQTNMLAEADGQKPTYWHFYNAITNMATHKSRSLTKEGYLQNKAFKVLSQFR